MSAVGGLTNIPGAAGDRVNQQLIVGVSCAILVILFGLQVGQRGCLATHHTTALEGGRCMSHFCVHSRPAQEGVSHGGPAQEGVSHGGPAHEGVSHGRPAQEG